MKPYLTVINNKVVVLSADDFRQCMASAIAAGLITKKPLEEVTVPDKTRPREETLRMQRICMARLRAEQRGNDTSEMPQRVRQRQDRHQRVKPSSAAKRGQSTS